MELLHFEVSLNFSEKDITQSIPAKVRAVLTGKPPNASDLGYDASVTATSSRENSLIRWNSKGCTFLFENEPNPQKCNDNVLLLLERIQSVAPIIAIEKTRCNMNWMLLAPGYDFVALERKYREVMTIPHEELVLGIYDSSVMFDVTLDAIHLHHQSGAMDPSQLAKNYLHFETVRDLPKAFFFLMTSVSSEDVVQYSESAVRQHLTRLVEYCETHSKVFEHIWRDVL